MFSYHGTNERCVVCQVAVPVGVAARRARANAAHWLAGSAGACWGGWDVRRLGCKIPISGGALPEPVSRPNLHVHARHTYQCTSPSVRYCTTTATDVDYV